MGIEEVDKIDELLRTEDPALLMDKFLLLQPKEIQLQVKKTIELWGIDKEDPMFLILIQCRICQVLYQLTPSQVNTSFEAGLKLIEQTLQTYQDKLLNSQKEQIETLSKGALLASTNKLEAEIANILEDNNLSFRKSRFSPRVVGSIVTAGAIFITAITTFVAGTVFAGSSLAESAVVAKTEKQRQLLNWAVSSEGIYARKLFAWNDDLLGRECEHKVKDLGITFKMGSAEVTKGFCVIKVVSPSSMFN